MINDAAGRYLHYVKEGLERAMVAADYDWFSAQDEDIERAAVAQRQTSHQSWLERQQFEAQQYSLADRDDIRIDAAKERREALHDSLNRAKGLTFEDTTWRSRFKELSRQQLVILEQRQVDRRILT
ncbi:unnamed protein product [Tilletia controversa]|nr:unnamed protein product [Tilletia controversa]